MFEAAHPLPAPEREPAVQARQRVAASHPLVVSVHLPKTAGTSFGVALRQAYGAGYLEDYGDLPMQHAPWARQWRALRAALRGVRGIPDPVRCIHGHFLAVKYRPVACRQKVLYITWLRDPVERLASHYHFWRRDYAGNDPRQPLRNRMLREDWSFERFALGPELRDVYSRYLWHFDPRRFDFIGITEHYERDLTRFAQGHLGRGFRMEAALVNPERGEGGYGIPQGLRNRIEAHHARDVALYHWARSRRPD
jgi:hypothetical protein